MMFLGSAIANNQRKTQLHIQAGETPMILIILEVEVLFNTKECKNLSTMNRRRDMNVEIC